MKSLNFEYKFEYILNQINSNFSIVEILDTKADPKYVEENAKNVVKIFENSKLSSGNLITDDVIYLLKSGIYLYLLREKDILKYKIRAYYTQEKSNEIKILIKNIEKWNL
jgi:hypothetical protein